MSLKDIIKYKLDTENDISKYHYFWFPNMTGRKYINVYVDYTYVDCIYEDCYTFENDDIIYTYYSLPLALWSLWKDVNESV